MAQSKERQKYCGAPAGRPSRHDEGRYMAVTQTVAESRPETGRTVKGIPRNLPAPPYRRPGRLRGHARLRPCAHGDGGLRAFGRDSRGAPGVAARLHVRGGLPRPDRERPGRRHLAGHGLHRRHRGHLRLGARDPRRAPHAGPRGGQPAPAGHPRPLQHVRLRPRCRRGGRGLRGGARQRLRLALGRSRPRLVGLLRCQPPPSSQRSSAGGPATAFSPCSGGPSPRRSSPSRS